MSLPASPCDSIAEQTIQVAHAAFPKGNPYIRMRDALGPIYTNPTFSPHVLAAIQTLNRLECVGEILRHARNVLATAAPDWLQS